MKRIFLTMSLVFLTACATSPSASRSTAASPATTSSAAVTPQQMSAHGAAGWIGQEFAGRTTANGEIFDPMLMTASHRTLPFGTLLDVKNPKTGQTVRVRVNDRGPYVGDRLIDLSFAAAQQIGLSETGGGEIDMTVVKVGRGDREPPAPFAVNVPDNSAVAAMPATPSPAPVTAMPMPMPASAASQPQPAPATVDHVEVIEQHADGSETRRQVAANGTSIVDVPVKPRATGSTPAAGSSANSPRNAEAGTTRTTHSPVSHAGRYVVQVGAFSQEANARALQTKLKAIGQESMIAHTSLYLVRIGPFDTREQAAAIRSKLEAAGISAIIVTP